MNSKKDVNRTGLKEQFNEKGLRVTSQRQAVIEVVSKNKGKHLSSNDIFELVKQDYPSIGLATIYRTLPLLEKMKLLNKICLDDGCVRYESYTPKEQEHHHLICMTCGAVYEVEEDLLGTREKQILKEKHFNITTYMVKLYGYCEKCAVNMGLNRDTLNEENIYKN